MPDNIQLAAWQHELRGPSGEWVTTLTGDQKFYHVTRRTGPVTHLPPSAAGESGPGVYLAGDKAYASKMASWDKTMRVLPVTVHAGNGLHLLDRTKPGGEEEYRRIQQMENGNKQAGLDKALAAHGYGGVRNLSPGNEHPETVIHDPGKLTVNEPVEMSISAQAAAQIADPETISGQVARPVAQGSQSRR